GYVIPALGGSARRIGAASRMGVSWSPSGRDLAVSWSDRPGVPPGIFLLSIGSGSPRRLTSPKAGWQDILPAFSPDGEQVAYVHADEDLVASELFVVPVGGGEPVRLRRDHGRWSGIAWHGQDEIVGSLSVTGIAKLWRVRV